MMQNIGKSARDMGAQTNVFVLLLFCNFLFYLFRVLYISSWLRSHDTVANIMNISSLICLTLSAIVTIFSSRNRLFDIRHKCPKWLAAMLRAILMLVAVLFLCFSYYWCIQEVVLTNIVEQTSGTTENYLVILSTRSDKRILIKVPVEDKRELIADKQVLYVISYRTLSTNASIGYLQDIEIDDYIDNRLFSHNSQ